MKTTAKSLIFLAIFLSFINTSYGSEIFTRYLQKGDQGSDVQILQRVLNSNPTTQVSTSGPGSLGNETDFFGEMTKQALIKYQKLNSLGNQLGFFSLYSGAVDEKTRSFLNSQLSTSSSATSTAQTRLNEGYKNTASPYGPFIGSINPSSVKQGDTITISGRNFSTSTPNTVNMTYNIVSATSTDGKTLDLKINSNLQSMFDKEARGLDNDDRNEVTDKMGSIPFFVTVSNNSGTSNPYQLYFEFK